MTLCELHALRGNSFEETWQLVLGSSKYGTGLSFFSSAKQDILGKGYTVVDSFGDHMPAFVHPSCFTAPD